MKKKEKMNEKRKKMMTDIKLGIIGSILVLMVILSVASMYIQINANELTKQLEEYNARKEDVLKSQRELIAVLGNLNKTLETEIAKETLLGAEIEYLTGEKAKIAAQTPLTTV